MKIGIDCGHTLSGADYGAVGIKEESKLTREVGEIVITKLQALKYNIVRCYENTCNSLNDSLSYRTITANNNNVDLFISIHFNAGGGHGTEIWTYGEKHFAEADRILNNICNLGYTDRGVKDGSKLYVLKNTKAKSMLVECCFIDSKEDMQKYNAENIADAIVKGITGQKAEIKKEVKRIIKYNESIPEGPNIFKIPNTNGYIEQATDGRLIIHKDRGNYIVIGKGFVDCYWNNNNGHSGSKRIGGN